MEEMKKLRDLLDSMHIEWTDHSEMGLYSIMRTWFEFNGIEWSCIYGFCSYGHEQGLLELWDNKNEPIGYLTANEVIEIINERGACK